MSGFARFLRLTATVVWLSVIWLGAAVIAALSLDRPASNELVQRAQVWADAVMAKPWAFFVLAGAFAILMILMAIVKLLEWMKLIDRQASPPSSILEKVLLVFGGVGLLMPVFFLPTPLPKAFEFEEIFPIVFAVVYSLFIVTFTILSCTRREKSDP